MKRTFNPPIQEQAGELALLVKAASTQGTDVLASIEAWNGVLVHQDKVRITSAGSRSRYVKAVCASCSVGEAEALSTALLKLGSQLPDRLNAEARMAGGAADEVPPTVDDLEHQAAALLAADDPLKAVAAAIRGLGYGGDLKPALTTYLAVTSRLLAMRPGAMPVHLLLLGPPSVGKSYTLGVVLSLHPPEAYHVIDAGSPRVLIYDPAPLKHRALIFGEADSLPGGDDNPAASAVRSLLQEHHLIYKVTVLNPESGQYELQEVLKEGPTVLITTAVRQLDAQLSSRLFALDIPYDLKQLQSALATQAKLEQEGAASPDPAVLAFDGYLQALAPWDVIVPFAGELARLIGQSASAPRINRDYSRLLALIKAVAIVRHRHRQRAANGRYVAEVADYDTVYRLVGEMYETAVTGVTASVRAAVTAVTALKDAGEPRVTVTRLAEHLGVSKMAASRAATAATKYGWLTNAEQRKGYPADLILGEPMPRRAGLPDPSEVVAQEGCNAVTPLTVGDTPPSPHRVPPSSVSELSRPDSGEGGVGLTVEAVTALHPESDQVCAGCGGPAGGLLGALNVCQGYVLHDECRVPVRVA